MPDKKASIGEVFQCLIKKVSTGEAFQFPKKNISQRGVMMPDKNKNRSIPFISVPIPAAKFLFLLLFLLLCPCLLSACGHTDDSTTAVSSTESSMEKGASLSQDPLWSDPESMTAMILSDLHYTDKKDLDHSLVPGLALSEEITDIVIDEVIDRHPDVLIMTGDNTNSGNPDEVDKLTAKLQRLRDEGIEIIVTTGNHDFDRMDAAGFEKAYFGLLSPVDRDPASLSYTSIVKDVVFLAMDDNAVYPGGEGEFSPQTIQWLEQMLEKYRGSTIIFLSHHNVLYGSGKDGSSPNLIRNPGLPSLLRENGVELAMTGHMHFPYILEKDGLWEILSGMPFSGQHLIGNLVIGQDHADHSDRTAVQNQAAGQDRTDSQDQTASQGQTAVRNQAAGQDRTDNPVRVLYYAEPIDFASYDKATMQNLRKLDQESSDSLTKTLSGLLDQEGLRGTEKREVLELINRYFLYYNSGSLAEAAQELKSDPSYKPMLQALWNYNYGPWMKEMIETTAHSSRELDITLSPASPEPEGR